MAAIANMLRHDLPTAVAEFDRIVPESHKRSNGYRTCRALLGPIDPSENEVIRELVEDLLDHPSTFRHHPALFALCQVSTPDEIKRDAERALCANDITEIRNMGILSTDSSIEYLAGRLTEEEFVKEASRGAYATAMVHATIAMRRVSEGKPKEAREALSDGS